MTTEISRRVRTSYALGSVGTGGFGTLPGLVLSYYLTDTLGVGAGLASLVVTVPKVWDVLIDPFIGRFSDRYAARHGSRRAFMLIGALTLPLTFTAVFAAPITGTWAAVWVVGAFVLATTSFSLFQVPYIALPADLAPDYHSRTRLLAPRIAVLAVAILLFGAGGPAVRDVAGGGASGYLVMAVVCALMMTLGMLVTTWGAGRPARALVPATPAEESGTGALRAGWHAVRTNAPLRTLLAAFVLQALATGAMLAAAQYVATYTLGDESAVTFLFAALVAPALLVMVPARKLAERIGKQRAFVAATVLFAGASGSLLLMTAGTGWWVYASVALAGIAYAGMQLYPLAMLPDVIAADRAVSGDRAGVISGVWTAGETAGLALGPTLALAVLAVTGFVSRTGPEVLDQPASALTGVVLIFSALPALLALASLVPLRRYRLDQKGVAL
ncbi:MFS transporter [Ruania zhangjianzhongii]|uniref:MFS transporter n=1 Tax=Ruania zhangjianzhongii TaxID=2603206 RepID=UPI0011CB2F04|nr:MFS transporter [Ruania zhangjianzhongii]